MILSHLKHACSAGGVRLSVVLPVLRMGDMGDSPGGFPRHSGRGGTKMTPETYIVSRSQWWTVESRILSSVHF